MGFKIKPKSQTGNVCTFSSSGNNCCSIVSSFLRCYHLTQGCSQSVCFWRGANDRRNWVREESVFKHTPSPSMLSGQVPEPRGSRKPSVRSRELYCLAQSIYPAVQKHQVHIRRLIRKYTLGTDDGRRLRPVRVVHTWNPSTQEAEAGRRIIMLSF